MKVNAREHRQYSRAQIGAVVAVVSPNCSWTANKYAAALVLDSLAAGIPAADVRPAGVYPENVAKAYALLDGPRVPLVCHGQRPGARGGLVKCNGKSHGCLAPLHGPKVAEFYRTIMGAQDGRVIDVWATRAAEVHPSEVATLNDSRREGIPGTRLPAFQAEYALAASAAGLHPAAFQAVVWIVIRTRWTRADGRRNGVR